MVWKKRNTKEILLDTISLEGSLEIHTIQAEYREFVNNIDKMGN